MSTDSFSCRTSRRGSQFVPAVAISSLVATLLGCGGSGVDSSVPMAAAVQVQPAAAAVVTAASMTPTSATVAGGATQTFSASVNGATDGTVIWSVDGIPGGNASVGTIASQAPQASFLRKAYCTPSSYSQTVSVQAGDLIIVGFSVSNSPAKTTCSDSSGNTYQAIGTQAYSSGVDGCANAFYTIAKATSSSLKVAISTLNNCDPSISVHVVAGGGALSLASVLSAYSIKVDTANATSHTTGTVVTTTPNDYLFTLWVQEAQATSLTEGSTGFSIQNADIAGNATSDKFVAAAGSYQEQVATSRAVMMGSITAAFRTAGSAATAIYTAPAAGGSHTITAASGTSTVSGTVTVSGPAPAVTVATSPASVSTSTGSTVNINATVAGSTNTAVTWTVDGVANGNATVGTLAGTGNTVTYTAPGAAGTHQVQAVSAANPATSAATAVTVLAPAPAPVVSVAVSPASATVNAGATAAVTAAVSGSTNTAVTWTVDGVANGNATTGTITGSGNAVVYNAPTVGGSHTVVATSAASASATAAMAVTVKPPVVTVALNPAGAASVTVAKPIAFTATVTGSSNTSVTWTVDGVAGGSAATGTISGTGNSVTYTAPALAGSHSVTATSVANPAYSAATTVSATPAPTTNGTTTAIVLTPSTPTAVGSGGTLAFSASTTGSSTDSVTWSVDGIAGGNASVGTISAAGVYTCPTVTAHAIHTITATSASSTSISASVDILATVSNTTVNAKTSYGAAGNGSSNDTSAINSALAAAGKGICLLPAGTYMVNATASGSYGIDMPSGATLLMAPGASIKCITQSTSGDYKVVRIAGSGSAVVGGIIYGDRVARNLPTFEDGVGTDFENGQGIAINGSGGGTGNIVLGVTSRDNACDGIYMYNGVNGVTIQDCTFDNNRRQGISIVYGTNVLIKNSAFTNTNGQDPAFGIDLEPSGSGQVVSYVQVLGCSFTANQGGGFGGGSSNASVNNITVSGSTFTGNGGHNYGVGGIAFNDGASNCVISNNTVTGSLAGGDQGGIMLEDISNFQVTGNTVKNNAGYGITLASAPGSSCSGNTVSGNSKGAIYSDGSASIGSNTIQ